MSRTVRKFIKPRLPMEAVLALRSKGGAETSAKGKKGYNRNQLKHMTKKEIAYD